METHTTWTNQDLKVKLSPCAGQVLSGKKQCHPAATQLPSFSWSKKLMVFEKERREISRNDSFTCPLLSRNRTTMAVLWQLIKFGAKNEALDWPCGNNIQSYATIMWKMLSSFRFYPVKLVASTHHQKYWSIGIIIPGRKEIRRTSLNYFVWSRMVSIKIFKTMLTCIRYVIHPDTYSDINSEICSHILIYLIRWY